MVHSFALVVGSWFAGGGAENVANRDYNEKKEIKKRGPAPTGARGVFSRVPGKQAKRTRNHAFLFVFGALRGPRPAGAGRCAAARRGPRLAERGCETRRAAVCRVFVLDAGCTTIRDLDHIIGGVCAGKSGCDLHRAVLLLMIVVTMMRCP